LIAQPAGAHHLKPLTALIEYAESLEQQWVSVSDRLPDICGDYLIWMPSTNEISWSFFSSDKKWAVGNRFYEGVTHWMPLPNPPKRSE